MLSSPPTGRRIAPKRCINGPKWGRSGDGVTDEIRSCCFVCCAAAAATANATAVGDGDPFALTFSSNGSGDITSCSPSFSCSFTGTDNGTAVTNIGGHGGTGYDFKLPQNVNLGDVGIFNSHNVLIGILDFIDATDMDFITGGNLSNYTLDVDVTSRTRTGPSNMTAANLAITIPVRLYRLHRFLLHSPCSLAGLAWLA